jgi:hypothetical protein
MYKKDLQNERQMLLVRNPPGLQSTSPRLFPRSAVLVLVCAVQNGEASYKVE